MFGVFLVGILVGVLVGVVGTTYRYETLDRNKIFQRNFFPTFLRIWIIFFAITSFMSWVANR